MCMIYIIFSYDLKNGDVVENSLSRSPKTPQKVTCPFS